VGRALTREGAITVSRFGYRKIGKEESEASTHELTKSRDLVQSPDCKEEIPWRVCCGYGFPDREIE
jgi:hypothetical protein